MTYFHGGRAGLSWRILPPSQSGAEHTVSDYALEEPGGIGVVDKTKVYVCTELEGAAFYAKLSPWPDGGWLYEVEPQGPLEEDPDWSGPKGISLRCDWALIRRVVRKYTADDCRRWATRYGVHI